MRKIFFYVCITLLISCKTSLPNQHNKTTVQPLFNGKNLKGWKNYGTEKWYVKNNTLVCENGPDKAFGYLGTQKAYKNFELTLEFKKL